MKSDKFQELLDMPLDVIFKREATVEWILKELGCYSNIQEIINNPIKLVENEIPIVKNKKNFLKAGRDEERLEGRKKKSWHVKKDRGM